MQQKHGRGGGQEREDLQAEHDDRLLRLLGRPAHQEIQNRGKLQKHQELTRVGGCALVAGRIRTEDEHQEALRRARTCADCSALS